MAVLGALLTVRTRAHLDAVPVTGLIARTVNPTLLNLVLGALATGVGAATGWGRATVFGITAAAGVLEMTHTQAVVFNFPARFVPPHMRSERGAVALWRPRRARGKSGHL